MRFSGSARVIRPAAARAAASGFVAGHVVGEFALAELAARKRVAQLGPAGLQIAALRPVGRVGVGAQQAVAKARQQAVRGAGGCNVKINDVQFTLPDFLYVFDDAFGNVIGG